MIDILKTVIPSAEQWEIAIEGMRNSFDSWDKSDSTFWEVPEFYCYLCSPCFCLGENDLELMKKLAASGSSHSKYRRMLPVYVTVNAPLYWLKEMDTYKVGTASNSCSTMHRIVAKKFTVDDFSHEHLFDFADISWGEFSPISLLSGTVMALNQRRERYLQTKSKDDWWQIIQLLPSSYNQKRTIMLNYEVLAKIYDERHNHKLDEWLVFCEWICKLPYSELITGYNGGNDEKDILDGADV